MAPAGRPVTPAGPHQPNARVVRADVVRLCNDLCQRLSVPVPYSLALEARFDEAAYLIGLAGALLADPMARPATGAASATAMTARCASWDTPGSAAWHGRASSVCSISCA